MDKIVIRGGAALRGTVALSGSKNATLPIMMAAVLTDEPVLIHNVPRLRDVSTAIDLLAGLGVEARWTGDHDLELCAARISSHEAPYELVKTMRASYVVLGPLLARAGLDAGRMRDRRAPGESAYRGYQGARRANSNAQRLRRSACATAHRRAYLARYAVRWRHRKHHDGGGACARAQHNRKRGARARSAGPRADAVCDGRANPRNRHARTRDRGR